MNKELHSQRGFLHGGLLKPQYSWFYNHGTHYRWWGHTSRGREMPWRGTRHGNGHDPCRSSRRVRATSFRRTNTCWNIIPSKCGPYHLLALGSGGEEEGLQQRQNKHPTTTRLDNSTRRRSHTWWIRLRSLCACVPPDDPEGLMARLLPTLQMIRGSCSCSPSLQLPSPPGGSCSRLSRRWADHQTIEPFSLQLRRWEKVVWSGDVRLWRITPIQHRVSLQRILS
jgi:hypothetical protein